jgi:septum formation protein
MKIVLASKSKNRQQLLDIAGIEYIIKPADVAEEAVFDPDPAKRIVRLAQAKARVAAQTEKNSLIIAADTFALYRGQMLEKPKTKTEAFESLKTLTGKTHSILSGWAVINTKNSHQYSGQSRTQVTFRDIGEKELLSYVNQNDVVNWAAAYSPYNTTAITFIEKVTGSITGFTHGLPLEQIMPVLIKEKVIS